MATSKKIKVGDLVIDAKTGVSGGIVYQTDAEPPDESWLKIQLEKRYRALSKQKDSVRWISAYALSGGSMLLAEPLIKSLGKPTTEQLRQAYARAEEDVQESLEDMFPFLKKDEGKFRPVFERELFTNHLYLLQVLNDPKKDLSSYFSIFEERQKTRANHEA